MSSGACPSRSIPWFLQFYTGRRDLPFGFAWAGLTALAVVWVGWLLVRVLSVPEQRSAIPTADRLPLFTGLCLLAGHITFPTIIDTYAIPFVPLILLVLGRELRDMPWPRPLLWACCAVWLCTLAYTACWLRGKLERYDALFTLADRIHASGVPARDISAGYHWDGYHGAFDDWLAGSDARQDPRPYVGPHRIDKAYHRFIAERHGSATYRVGADEADPTEPGWRVIDRATYRDARFRLHHMVALQRAATP